MIFFIFRFRFSPEGRELAEFQTRCNEYETDLEVSKNRWGTLSLKSMKKINEKAQTANFSDFTRQR